MPYPTECAELHHEIELVVALRAGGADNFPNRTTMRYPSSWGYGTGLDMTRRDMQAIAKENGSPTWDMAEGLRPFCAHGRFLVPRLS